MTANFKNKKEEKTTLPGVASLNKDKRNIASNRADKIPYFIHSSSKDLRVIF